MNEDFYQRLKKEIERALDRFDIDEKSKIYQRLYFSSLGAKTSDKKASTSSVNGKQGGRPRLKVSEMKNPKMALWKRKRREELKKIK